jgi:hypothetical protein
MDFNRFLMDVYRQILVGFYGGLSIDFSRSFYGGLSIDFSRFLLEVYR